MVSSKFGRMRDAAAAAECLDRNSPEGREGVPKAAATAPATTTAAAAAAAAYWPRERTEAVRSWAGMAVVMHEEGTPVGHKRGVLVPPTLVFLVFAAPAVAGGTLGGTGGRRGAYYERSIRRELGRASGDDVIEMHLLDRLGLLRDGEAVEHHLGVGDGLAMGLARCARGLRGAVPRLLPGIGHGWRGIILDVARIAVVGRIVISEARAIGEGVVVEVEGVGASFVVSFVLHPAAADPSASGSGHGSAGIAGGSLSAEGGGSGVCGRERELRWHPLGYHSRTVELVIKAEGGLMGADR